MCEAKEEAKTKLDRLISAMDDLASAIHSLNETLSATRHDGRGSRGAAGAAAEPDASEYRATAIRGGRVSIFPAFDVNVPVPSGTAVPPKIPSGNDAIDRAERERRELALAAGRRGVPFRHL